MTQKALKDALKQIFPNLDEVAETNSSPRCWLGFEWTEAANYKRASLHTEGHP